MSAIKPPAGSDPSDLIRSLAEQTSKTESREAAAAGEAPGASTQTAEAQTATGPTSAADVQQATDASAEVAGGADVAPLDALAADLDAGRVQPEAALDALVERALADVDVALSQTERADLEATLRSALQHDPTLVSLRDRWPHG